MRTVPIVGHASRGISAEGRQVIFGGKERWSTDGYTDMGAWNVMFDMETGVVTYLNKVAKGAGLYHMSANSISTPGWGLVSVYGPKYPTVPTTWDEESSYLVELTTRTDPPPRVWRLGHTHDIYTVYGSEPFAKINKKGTKVWFGSAWGVPYTAGAYDVYQIDLPATWYSDLMSFNIITSSLPSGTGGSAYSQTLQASGGTTPYTWSITSGSLPTGLSLNSSTGVISGIPTTGGTFSFTIQLKDASNQTATKSLSITINVSDTTPPAPPSGVAVN
jgi:hypothetical protein